MNLPALLSILGLACYSALFYVVVSSPIRTRGKVRRLFVVSLVVMVAWQVSALVVSLAGNEYVAMAGYQAMSTIVVTFGVAYALFVRTFLMMENNQGLALGGGVLCVGTLILVILDRRDVIHSVYWNETTAFYLPRFGPLAPVVGVPYYLLLGYVAVLLLRGLRRARQPLVRSRIQYLFAGWCLLLIGTLANFIPALKNYPIDLMGNVMNAVLIAYAIFRYQLLDISLVIRKGLAYSIPTTIIAIGYFLVVFVVEKLLRAFVGYQVFLLSLLVAALTAIAAQPLRDKAQLWVDRLFFRDRYDAQLMLQELSELATSILDIDRLSEMLLDRLMNTMHVELACIMVKEKGSGWFYLVASKGTETQVNDLAFRPDHPVVRWMTHHKAAITFHDLDVMPQFKALWGQEREELDQVDARLLIPLLARGELIGILILGPKLSNTTYSQDEQLTLTTLANQVAIAIENAHLFGEAQVEIAERERAQVALRESRERYRSLFEESPIALWEVDFSDVKHTITSLRRAGVDDLSRHFETHPELVSRYAALVKVVRVNKATLEMYHAETLERFREGIGRILVEETSAVFQHGVAALADGQTRFEGETVHRTLQGHSRTIDLRWSVVPGYEASLSMVLVSAMDITESRARETMLRRRTARLELLREIDEAILETRSLDDIMEITFGRMRQLLNCEGASLVTVAGEAQDTSAMRSEIDRRLHNTAEIRVTWDAVNRRHSEALHSLLEGRVYVVEDLDAVSGRLPLIQQLREFGHRSALLVPVLHRQPQLVDTLVLMAKEPGAFDDDDKEVGKEVAHSLALAIRHTAMRREIEDRTQALEQQLARVSLFNEITRVIAARYDLDSILRVVAQRLEDDFTDLASIWLGDGDVYASGAHHTRIGNPMANVDLFKQLVTPSELPELRALQEERARVAYLDDLTRFDVLHVERLVERLQVHSAVIVPLVVDGSVFGFMVSARRERDAFSRAERDFLVGLGEHVALAIHQARLHEDLEAAYNELRETQRAVMRQERLRALGEMASGIAHDINNAISPIPLYTNLIESKAELPPEAQAYLDTIKIAVKDIEETVRRMRKFYRQRDEEELLPVDISRAAQHAIELTRPRWRDVPQEEGITVDLQTDFQEDLPLVLGNEAEIRHAVTNLILNAVDAMPTGGTLTLRTYENVEPSPNVVLEVADSGIGMDEETRERAFEPFFSTKGARGSGMGLATVYGTMQRHEGAVGIDSALGEGTTMRLIFPVPAEIRERIDEEIVLPSLPMRILCVDDEPLLREALKEILENEGHNVELADGGVSGLDAFRAAYRRGEPFEVVITDLGMPHVDGRQVARIIKTEAPETPVILLTGWGQRLRAENEIPEDVDVMLSKPPRIELLNRALSRVALGND